ENWHIECIAEHLDAVSRGQIMRLIINQPPRSMKSTLVSIMWPVWSWAQCPELRWMFASYAQSLSTFHSIQRRLIIQSPWFRARWGAQVRLADDQNQKMEFYNTRQGMMIATSVGGTSIGKGGDVLVFDDPLNPTEASSLTERETANNWIRQGFLTRLNDQKTGRIVGVMQRLHERDTTGMLLELGGWEHLCLPAEAERRTVIHFPISGRELVREPGDILFPEREGPAEIARKKIELGAYGYAGQYQQRPSPAGGGILKDCWWRYWYPADRPAPPPVVVTGANGEPCSCPQVPLPMEFERWLESWDCNMIASATSDLTVGQVWAKRGAEKYLLDQVSAHADVTIAMQMVTELSAKWPQAQAKYIEAKAAGPEVIRKLGASLSGLIAVTPKGDKISRVRAVEPTIQAGDVYLPHPTLYPWVSAFVGEHSAFPTGAKDDQVDATSQALSKMLDYAAEEVFGALESETSEDASWQETLVKLGGVAPGGAVKTGW
ncbi:MAG TPA: phage terminase large subunit, partial [Armatimonadota bacterium]